MSKVLYFDCFAGISGDMTLGALLDVGADLNYLRNELSKLNLGQFEICARKATRLGIAGTDVQVAWPGKLSSPNISAPIHYNHHHSHDGGPHSHHYPEHTTSQHLKGGGADAGHIKGQNRNLGDIEALINQSALNARVKSLSLRIFQALAQAEAQVHGRSIDAIHFHEVGAIDSIVDIVGTAICIDYLEIEKIYSSPLHLGSGFLQCAHGTLPVEAPATMALLKGVPVYSNGVKHELVTPTGAAIITSLAEAFVPLPELVIERVGYGAGDNEMEIPNLLRIILAQQVPAALVLLESNIDDMNPQIYSHLFPLLFEEGALDVYLTPIIMKKNRPGTILSVLCPLSLAHRLEQIIFLETTTLGIRRIPVTRNCLQRELRSVHTPWGQVQVKAAVCDGRILRVAPEFEDCSRLARQHQVPLQEVINAAHKAAEQTFF